MKTGKEKPASSSRFEEMKIKSDNFVKEVRRQERQDGKIRHITSEEKPCKGIFDSIKSILLIKNH